MAERPPWIRVVPEPARRPVDEELVRDLEDAGLYGAAEVARKHLPRPPGRLRRLARKFRVSRNQGSIFLVNSRVFYSEKYSGAGL